MSDPLSAQKPGAAIKGTVVAKFFSGAIVDIGIPNAEGFLHELDSPSRHGPSPVLGLQAEQAVTAWVLDANPTTRRVALTLVNPATLLRLADLREDQQLEGIVVRLTDIGAFVDVRAERDGLVHISEIERTERWGDPSDLEQGDEVTVYVNWVDLDENKLSLRLLPEPRLRLDELEIGASYDGYVVRIEPYGAFVDIDAESTGLVHVSEMAHGYVAHPANVVQLDQTVTVRIKSVDVDAGKFSLTMK